MRGSGFGGLWLALIRWFLIAAATVEGRPAQLRGVLAGVPVWDAMTGDPLTVPTALTVADLLADPRYRYRHSAFLVTGVDGAPVGLVTLESARQELLESNGRATDLLPRIEPGDEHRVLVMDEGRLIGILSLSDISRTVTWLMNPASRR